MAYDGSMLNSFTPYDGLNTASQFSGAIPTRVSQLINDELFIADTSNAFGYSNLYGAPSNVSQFFNDAQYFSIGCNISLLNNDANYVSIGCNVSLLNNDAKYIKDAPLAFTASNLSGSNIVSTLAFADYAGGVLQVVDNWSGHMVAVTYTETVWVDNWVPSTDGTFSDTNVPIATYVERTSNVLVIDTHTYTKTEVPDKHIDATLHTLYPSISVHASNVIGGTSRLPENALPVFLEPSKIISLTQTGVPTNTMTSATTGNSSISYTSNVRYKLPDIIVASENVLGDNLTVNSNIYTSNLSASNMNVNKIQVQTNVQIINGPVTGSYLNMTGASSCNIIAGTLRIKGVTNANINGQVPWMPTYFREFQCGYEDTSNPYDAAGDPGYGFFGGFTIDPMYVSYRSDGFTRDTSYGIELERQFKSISRYHKTKAWDDAQVKNTYQHGWNSGHPVYPTNGYTWGLRVTDTIVCGNRLIIFSDERIKSHITPANSNICLLAARCLKPSCYTHLQDNTFRLGFIAQEVKEILPEAVDVGPGELVNGDKVDDFHVLDYNTITTVNTSAIQALANELEKLKNRLKSIEDGQLGCGHSNV